MKPFLKFACVAAMAIFACAGLARAEGSLADEEAALRAKPAARRIVKPKPKPAPVLPAAPIAYNAYNGATPLSAKINKALTPEAAAPLPPPVAILPAPLPVQPIAAPPPAPPQSTYAPQDPTHISLTHISLKCDTRTTEGQRLLSHGTFYIDLFPSPVFPDEHADFQFLFVDPAHDSLIRDSICLDTTCAATVTGAAYYLVNRVTRKGAALRITLDRSKGAFYAEEIGKNGRKGDDRHRGEQGYCSPQTLPNKLF